MIRSSRILPALLFAAGAVALPILVPSPASAEGEAPWASEGAAAAAAIPPAAARKRRRECEVCWVKSAPVSSAAPARDAAGA